MRLYPGIYLRGRGQLPFIVFILEGRCFLFYIQNEAKRRVAIEIIAMKPFTPQEAQSFVELHCCSVGDFGLEGDLCASASSQERGCRGSVRTSSASRSIMRSIDIRTSLVAIPEPRCSSLTASMAI